MDFRLDQSLVALGIGTVVVRLLEMWIPKQFAPSFLEKKKSLNNGRSSVR